MKLAVCSALAALALAAGFAAPARAQDKPTIAIMPAQWFNADQASAERLTQGLVEQYERQNYRVIDMSKSRSTFQSMGLQPNVHYSDATAIKFGQQMGADLVAYPRLLAMGLPASSAAANSSDNGIFWGPEAVVHLRVMNVHAKTPIYFRQIGHEFRTDSTEVASDFPLPQPVASAAAGDVTGNYFQRVAGSRQEFRRNR